MKYRTYMAEWLKALRRQVKSKTYNRIVYYAIHQIVAKLGDYELEELKVPVIQKFIGNLSDNFSPGTVNGIVSIMRDSLTSARADEVTEVDFTGKIHYKYKREYKIMCLKESDQAKLESYIESNMDSSPKLYGIMICLYTGLRVGELMALRWSDIDFGKKLMSVNKTCHDDYTSGEYKKCIETPKTSSSFREIPLTETLLSGLRKLRRVGKSEYVIEGKDGKLISIRSYQKTFGSVLKKLGIPHIGMHGLRHTFATRSAEYGMDVKTLSEILGHSNPMITLKCYVHSMMDHKRAMMRKVSKAFENNSVRAVKKGALATKRKTPRQCETARRQSAEQKKTKLKKKQKVIIIKSVCLLKGIKKADG